MGRGLPTYWGIGGLERGSLGIGAVEQTKPKSCPLTRLFWGHAPRRQCAETGSYAPLPSPFMASALPYWTSSAGCDWLGISVNRMNAPS